MSDELRLPLDDLPITPYRGTGGSVPREASIARAEHDVKSGKLGARQELVLSKLRRAGIIGATWKELGQELNLHHGQISGVLSNLHKEGRVFMLRHMRDGSHPYCHKGIQGHFQPEQIWKMPTRTSGTAYREAYWELREAVEACRKSGFSNTDINRLLDVLAGTDLHE